MGSAYGALSSNTLAPWVVNFRASYYICGDKSVLSNIVYSQSFPVGQADPICFITLIFVLCVRGCPFNLASVNCLNRALNCAIIFLNDSFVIVIFRNTISVAIYS